MAFTRRISDAFYITTVEQGTHQVGSFYTAEQILGQAVLMAAIPRLPRNSGKEHFDSHAVAATYSLSLPTTTLSDS